LTLWVRTGELFRGMFLVLCHDHERQGKKLMEAHRLEKGKKTRLLNVIVGSWIGPWDRDGTLGRLLGKFKYGP
jgi:hypothetical protein